MTDDTHLTTRRGLLSSIAMAIGASSAGCLTTGGDRTESGSSTTGSRPSTSSDASGGEASTASPSHRTTDHSPETRTPADRQSTETPTTPADRDHATNTPSRETTTTDQPSGSTDYVSRFKGRLTDRFVPVKSISVTDGRVQLRYVARSDVGHEVAAGIETVVVSFIQVYKHGWDVEAVDAKMMDRHHPENVMGRWRLEARWVEQTLHGEWSRTDLLSRVLDSYHGELKKEDHHHGDGHHTHDGTTTPGG